MESRAIEGRGREGAEGKGEGKEGGERKEGGEGERQAAGWCSGAREGG